jgi:membrane protease YdiL (CAAX protease family)
VVESTSDGNPRRLGSPIRQVSGAPIDVTTALVTFVASWLVAQLAASFVISALGDGSRSLSEISIGVLAASLGAAWTCYLVGMWVASDRAGSGRFAADYGLAFRPVDAAGLGIGVLSQLVVVNLIYLPLKALRPDSFTDERLQQNAKQLVGRASGGSTLLLVLLVGFGAPVVEELVYRGLLQRSLLARYREWIVVVGVAALFAIVHFRVIEYPGLFAFGLILGVCAARTGRLGMGISAHIAFNLTGLVLAR